MKSLSSFLSRIALACSLPLLFSCATERPVSLLGTPADPAAGVTRTIVIGPDTNHVDVTGGDTIRFVAGEKSFAWNFFVGSGISSFSLNAVAPPGVLDHPVQAYVAPDPRYIGGNDEGDK